MLENCLFDKTQHSIEIGGDRFNLKIDFPPDELSERGSKLSSALYFEKITIAPAKRHALLRGHFEAFSRSVQKLSAGWRGKIFERRKITIGRSRGRDVALKKKLFPRVPLYAELLSD